MLTLITGLPGNGKTLFALSWVKEKSEKEGRPVFYYNIKDLALPWTLIDPEKWFDCPPGSIIFIDEAQQVFPNKPNGAARPEHYEKIAVHRHNGVDIVVVTQHPGLIDTFLRHLVGQHFHVRRKFGMESATIYEWDKVNPQPQNPAQQKTAIPMKWKYPKLAYTWYKSAEVHTVKRRIPAKVFLALGFVGLVVVAGLFFMRKFEKPPAELTPVVATAADGQPVNVNAVAPGGRVVASNGPDEPFDPVADAREYVAMNTPRVEGLPHTAPRYDEITRPVRAPVPAACIQVGTRRSASDVQDCKCYNQDGRRMDVPFNMCVSIAQNGWFKDFNEDQSAKGGEGRQVVQQSGEPKSSSVAQDSSSTWVASFPDTQRPVVVAAATAPAEGEGNPRPGRATRNTQAPHQ